MFRRFVAALRFLTILPVPTDAGLAEDDLAASLPMFPLVGLLLGMMVSAGAWCVWQLFPVSVAAPCATLFLLAVSGGLHLDGLADTADGFFSGRPREQVLEIMRDSRIGAMGVVALVMVLMLKTGALASLDGRQAGCGVLLALVAGRCSIVMLMALLPYARARGGLATLFYTRATRGAGIWASIFFLACSLVAGGRMALFLAASLAMLVLGMALFCRQRIGGATGDTLGAVCELAETTVLIVFSLQNI